MVLLTENFLKRILTSKILITDYLLSNEKQTLLLQTPFF